MEPNVVMRKYIALDRQFSPVIENHKDSEELDASLSLGMKKAGNWKSLLSEYRTVILAEAGAGKTVELMEMASKLSNEGKWSFFIRIEDIDRNFDDAFEIGDEDKFEDWLNSNDEAWFFLDSVDEAKLAHPRAFERAIKRFAKGIGKGAKRAHIYISSRPYSWRAKSDKALVDTHLFYPSTSNREEDNNKNKHPKSALNVYSLRPLDRSKVHTYCIENGVKNIDELLDEVERLGLWNLAERPFDLDIIITKWLDDQSLDGRLHLLQHSVDVRLSERHNNVRQPLNLDKAREGAQRLAAAVILTGNAGINVPDAEKVKQGIDADIILYDWEREDVKSLLECGLFNDIIYGAVRFRHRDIRELLAAQFFGCLLKEEGLRSQIESYFIREVFGETVVTPLFRPILPWLILFDDRLRAKILDIKPEIALEEGDPSRLPLSVRRRILSDVVAQIADDTDGHSGRDNAAIARIALPDLTEGVLNLIHKYADNDDAIFFLGRLVWQGKMDACTEPFTEIAVSGERGKYARIASVRAVLTCGYEEQKDFVWREVISRGDIPRDLLSELVDHTAPSDDSIKYLVDSIHHLVEPKRFESSMLDRTLHDFIERAEIKFIPELLKGIGSYLDVAPFVERRDCRVSEQYAWLFGSAIKCLEKLVVNRDPFALSEVPLSILANVGALQFWREDNLDDVEHDLGNLVPEWQELNDALYWYSIEKARKHLSEQDKPLTDDWSISYLDHFWAFNGDDLSRLVSFVSTRLEQDDRLVALNAAFRLYQQLGSPVNMLEELRIAVYGEEVLVSRLENLLNPITPESTLRYEAKEAEYRRQVEKKRKERESSRIEWIQSLQENPSQITAPNVKSGEITNIHVWLLSDLEKDSSAISRRSINQWERLIPEFGLEVANAYKEFCMDHWRNFRPQLHSENEIDNSIPYALLLGLAGLEIQAKEDSNFPKSLSSQDLGTLLRYITWDINGFPSWLEVVHRTYPEETNNAILKEVFWELENNSKAKKVSSHILHDLVYHVPWLKQHLAGAVFEYLIRSAHLIQANKEYCLRLLIEGGISARQLSLLAQKYISASQGDDHEIAWWYALLVDSEPDQGIPGLEEWLATLEPEQATHAAEVFLEALLGGRSSHRSLYNIGQFKVVAHLKALYVLMHKYIRVSDDLNRAGTGVYSPTTRDHAQEARDMLFNYLVELPSKESYCALTQLIKDHPDESHRPWMRKSAYKMAEAYGDVPLWSDNQFKEFHKTKQISPESHRQLFELGIQQILSIKDWVENGNDSPWMTWQRATKENEVRTLIAAELRKSANGHYSVAEEPELANEQRMDIWLANPNVMSPVPIELKLLDKGWSGPELCERLRNQLVGDYLREGTAGCGVFLLVSQKSTKCWEIGGKRVGIDKLASALKDYWKSIAHGYVGIDEIEVIVIDMNKRALVSDS
ncbi:NACHT domain-containing protein [Vibrio tapetis]|uniref:Uncharacterized protein n=1 Tax=Vibrio tapetis subsp. tapetis TaxID=1671868 RepID=A0A2N8ZDV0_9VIBR|nr:hypothetical protein [Vibrio tapetis]SON50091.1 conserved protein of unknown function [Vibrio tapetis subsp. tapetis]